MSVAVVDTAPRSPLLEALELKRRNAWQPLAALGSRLDELEGSQRLALVDAVAFALGQLERNHEAVALLEPAWDAEPTYRRAAALAYLHYDAALRLRGATRREPDRRGAAGPGRPNLELLRRGFRRWIAEALRLSPGSIKDLYRLGIFEAQVESRHDKVALRAFLAAIEGYRQMPPPDRERRHDLLKYYVRALYGGARSALRLGRVRLARLLSFQCIREDRDRDHVAPIHKLGLAGKACLAAGELDHADRAFRLALDSKGPPRRDYLFGMLAEVEHRRGHLDAASRWIEGHVRPERRSPPLWRQLGDLRREQANLDGALAAYEASLSRDRCGRHLTLIRIGDIRREQGRAREAAQAYRKAIEFARRQYLMEPAAATAGLAACAPCGPELPAPSEPPRPLAKTGNPAPRAEGGSGAAEVPRREAGGSGS